MNYVVIGTAGHIDHGKTQLIKALTGRNTDRLKEELQRGISIDLGFTYFELPNGKEAAIIDVPGHEKFIKNMLAGVVGMDMMLFVVAANEGVMPQTIEHFNILKFTGKKNGIVVLTKCDLVDELTINNVKKEIKGFTMGSFLEKSPIVAVSSTTGEGINELKQIIIENIKNTPNIPENKGNFRMPVDRVFIKKGIGTIVTGTIIEGQVSTGDLVEIYPKGLKTKVKGIQVHNKLVDKSYDGQRCALNVSNVSTTQVKRGDVISNTGYINPANIFDIQLKIINDDVAIIKNNEIIKFNIGSTELDGRIALLGTDKLTANQHSYAQVFLKKNIAVKEKDFFVIRKMSPTYTVGGGRILFVNPPKRKRNDINNIKELEYLNSEEKLKEVSIYLKYSNNQFEILDNFIEKFNINNEDLKKNRDILQLEGKRNVYVIHHDNIQRKIRQIIKHLTKYHENNIFSHGIKKENLRIILGYDDSILFDSIINYAITNNLIKIKYNRLALYKHEIVLSTSQKTFKNRIIEIYKVSNLESEKIQTISKKNPKDFMILRNILIEIGELISLDDKILVHREIYNSAYDKLISYLKIHNNIDVKTFRDLMKINRKYSIAFLEYFDKIKLTKRIENYRILCKDI